MDPIKALDITIKFCTAVTVIAAVVNIVVTLVGRLKAPEVKQDERLTDLEARVSTAERLLATDKERFGQLERGNQVVLKSLLALMSHAIDGNDIDGLKSAKKELSDYLVEK